MPNVALKLVILGSPLKGALILFVKDFPRMCHSPEKVQGRKSSVRFHYLNIIFTQIFFDTGCQFGLFHLQQWGRGEISPNGSHSDWQPVSPGKPYSLCCKSPSLTWYSGLSMLHPSCHSFPRLPSFLSLQSADQYPWAVSSSTFLKKKKKN